MVATMGPFQDGIFGLDADYPHGTLARVVVSFLDDTPPTSETRLAFTDFSFAESRAILRDVQGALSDDVVEERRSGL